MQIDLFAEFLVFGEFAAGDEGVRVVCEEVDSEVSIAGMWSGLDHRRPPRIPRDFSPDDLVL